MRAAETHHGVCSECEGDEASGHLEVGVEERVGLIGGIAKNPEKDEVKRDCDHSQRSEVVALQNAPKFPLLAHTSPVRRDKAPT